MVYHNILGVFNIREGGGVSGFNIRGRRLRFSGAHGTVGKNSGVRRLRDVGLKKCKGFGVFDSHHDLLS